MVSEHDENEEHAQAGGGDREEVEGDEVAGMIGKERRHVWEGGGRRFGSSREMVRSATLIPSFCSSPWILGAPHKGFAAAMRVIKARSSAFTGGRPPGGLRGQVGPMLAEAPSLPPQDGVGSHDQEM